MNIQPGTQITTDTTTFTIRSIDSAERFTDAGWLLRITDTTGVEWIVAPNAKVWAVDAPQLSRSGERIIACSPH